METETPTASNNTTVKPSSSRLKAAPRKSVGKRKSWKKLFQNTVSEQTEKEMLSILPSVLSKLRGAGFMIPFCMFLRMISTDKFPLHNIALLLFFDVVRWYSLENTSQMLYSPECMKFWKVMYIFFHGKTFRFMAGMKSSNQTLDMNFRKGHIDPNKTSINFAVPTQKYVTDFETSGTDIPKEIRAGIISQALNVKDKNKEYVVSFDGKKLAPGLSKDKGDQDLFGHEAGESLYEAKARVDREIKCTIKLTEKWKGLSKEDKIEKLQSILKPLLERFHKDLF